MSVALLRPDTLNTPDIVHIKIVVVFLIFADSKGHDKQEIETKDITFQTVLL